MRSEPAVAVRGLRKAYGPITAVDGIDLEVARGEFLGLLGPNGAGKSTTLRVITCLAQRDAGDVRVLGMDPATESRQVKRRLGVVTQDNTLDLELTVRENLLVFARYFEMERRDAESRADALLGFMELADRSAQTVQTLSGGMQRRLQIARALMSEPELIVLDEPTTGLDPHARHIVWERLRTLKKQGTTLLLTTHYMDEAAQLCDRVAVIDDGRIIAQGAPATLIHKTVGEVAAVVKAPIASITGTARRFPLSIDRTLVFGRSADDLRRSLGDADIEVLRPTSLEDVFLVLTGSAFEESTG